MGENIALVKSPRLCRIEKGANGYGFNLHGEKGVVGQYISAVDAGSPAEKSGLSVGDRVIEVNENNVENSSHADVVKAIKEFPNHTSLLVIDRITDNYMKIKKIPVTSDLAKYSSVLDIPGPENSTSIEVVATDTEVNEKKDTVENEKENKFVENEKEDKFTDTVKTASDIEGLYDSPNSLNNKTNLELPVEINENAMMAPQIEAAQGDEVHSVSQISLTDAVRSEPHEFQNNEMKHVESKQEHKLEDGSLIPNNQQCDSENPIQESEVISVNEPKAENEGEKSHDHSENGERFEDPPVNAISANTLESALPSQSHTNNDLKKPLLSVIPQRKKVKETKDDWKAKQDLFNKL